MRRYVKTLSALLILAAVSTAHAQQQGGPPDGGMGNGAMGNDGGPPTPEDQMQRMDARIKKALAVNDDAWATLQPMIDKVQQLEHETDAGPMMHGRPPRPQDQDNAGGPPAEADDHPQSEIESAVTALKAVLADKTSTDDKIENAMKAVQDAQKKAKEDLADARKSLRAAVSMRQQAVLVAMGVLN